MNVLTDIPYTKKIYTHSNTFHADEMMAIALLQQYIFNNERVEIIRTRDKTILEKAKNEEGTFVIDVGFIYDPSKLNFDHHQSEMNLGWENGILYSSCGLIWKWLRDNKVLNQYMNDETMDMMEDVLIKRVDAADNGQAPWNEGAILAGYNRNDDTPDGSKQMKQFLKAVNVSRDVLQNVYSDIRSELKAKKKVMKALETTYDKKYKILALSDNTYHDYIVMAMQLTNNELNMLVYPHSKNRWVLKTAPSDPKNGYSTKNPSPETWRGRDSFNVVVHGKNQKIIFSHKSGFMSIIDGSLEDAVDVAKFVVEWNLDNKLTSKSSKKVNFKP
jgi:uncharacterized UPF0160 family protein